jgi:SAM-dependent methyltransferase
MANRESNGQRKIFGDRVLVCAPAAYQPLPSVWEGSDADLLERMLDFYPRKQPGLVLDATMNAGRFWVGSQRNVVGLDVNRHFRPHVLADNRCMPLKDGCFDVVVYDPPHIPNQGRDQSKDFNQRFGLVLKSSARNGYNLTHLYPPFLREAYRVLRPEGVLFCKVADYVHNHRYQWAHVELVRAAIGAGFIACDCIIKARKGPLVDPKWKIAHHARRHHCYWLVFRKSSRCE